LVFHLEKSSIPLDMKESRIYKFLPWLAVFVYVGMVVLGDHFHGGEIFPFFNWRVYAHTTRHLKDYAVLINASDGEQHVLPLDFVKSKESFSKLRFLCRGDDCENSVIAKWGTLYEKGRTQGANYYRMLFEKAYLGGYERSLDYTLVKRFYDPIDAYLGKPMKREALISYSVERGSE